MIKLYVINRTLYGDQSTNQVHFYWSQIYISATNEIHGTNQLNLAGAAHCMDFKIRDSLTAAMWAKHNMRCAILTYCV